MGLLARLRSRDARRDPESFVLARDLFLRLLGVVHGIAHLSLWVQIEGLVGSRGLLPLAPRLEAAHARLGGAAYAALPTLCWLSAGDAFLNALCVAGVALAVALALGVAPLPALVGLWTTYLSLCVAGQVFLGFQWDALLLEATLAGLFMAPAVWRVRPRALRPPPRAGLLVVRCLLFKLMFLSGVTKLLSGDPSWRDGSALAYHYETQPLPAWTSWYAHQLPGTFHAFSTYAVLAIEIVAPFGIFAPRRLRHAAGLLLVTSQVAIAATGSYGFFNLLTVALCVPLFDDRLLRRVLPAPLRARLGTAPQRHPGAGGWPRRARVAAAAAVLLLSGLTGLREMVRSARPETLPAWVVRPLAGADAALLSWAETALLAPLAPFRTVSGYGLFRVMTTRRPEIGIEGTRDGRAWLPYAFRWKPGDVYRRPRFAAPHMPRLDWQMWFAALDPPGNSRWLDRLVEALLRAQPDVLALLAGNPFPDVPPSALRLVYYRYRFTDREQGAATGAWWRREELGRTGAIVLPPDE